MKHFVASIFALFLVALTVVKGETFTSIEHLATNLLAEEQLIKALNVLIAVEKARLEKLTLKLDYYKAKHAEADNPAVYLSNPLNAFQLIKRLTLELNDVENLARQNGYLDFLSTLSGLRQSDEDLLGAGTALVRLQDTYDLLASDFSEGIINGVQYNASLSVDDCLEIGIQSYNAGDFYHAVLWLREALRKYDAQQLSEVQVKESILAYLAPSFYKTGYVKEALEVTKLMVALNSDNVDNRKLMQLLMIEVAKLNEKTGEWTKKGTDFDKVQLDRRQFVDDKSRFEATRQYELLCQGRTYKPTKNERNLRCRYMNDRSWFLKIAPFKVEEVRRHPEILLFHDVIADSEIDEIKHVVDQKLRRATISDTNGANIPALYRISKSGWLKDEESERVRTLSRRVEDMTGMTVATAEELQVVNYGIGGQYVPHYDFARDPTKASFANTGLGNRVSTVLFYMSDVEQGGGTVFPQLNVSVSPKKGSALFWYNLHKTGEMDFRTIHAGCPVLVGNKWVCNKWQHIVGQERSRPCDLTPDYPLTSPTK